MVTTLQILGLVIPIAYIIGVFGYSFKRCTYGKGNEPVPTWVALPFFLSLLVLGFTIGTIVSKF